VHALALHSVHSSDELRIVLDHCSHGTHSCCIQCSAPPLTDGAAPCVLQVLQRADHLHFDRYRTIIREGAMGFRFYLIIKGKVRVSAEAADICFELPNAAGRRYFGETSLVSPQLFHGSTHIDRARPPPIPTAVRWAPGRGAHAVHTDGASTVVCVHVCVYGVCFR
jgi:hypothetical protein